MAIDNKIKMRIEKILDGGKLDPFLKGDLDRILRFPDKKSYEKGLDPLTLESEVQYVVKASEFIELTGLTHVFTTVYCDLYTGKAAYAVLLDHAENPPYREYRKNNNISFKTRFVIQ